MFSSASTELTSFCTIANQFFGHNYGGSQEVSFQMISRLLQLILCLFWKLVRPSANVVSLYFRPNCVITLNTVLPLYWLFSLLFDGTKGTVINKNSNIIMIIIMIIIIRILIMISNNNSMCMLFNASISSKFSSVTWLLQILCWTKELILTYSTRACQTWDDK